MGWWTCLPVCCEGNGFAVASNRQMPSARAALVALGLASLLEPASEKEVVASGEYAALGGVGERNDFTRTDVADKNELSSGQSGITRRSDDEAAIRRKSRRRCIPIPGAALRKSATDRHGVDLRWSFKTRAEGNGLSIGGENGIGFDAGIRS